MVYAINGLMMYVRNCLRDENDDLLGKLRAFFKYDKKLNPRNGSGITLFLFDKYFNNVKGRDEDDVLSEVASIVSGARAISNVWIICPGTRDRNGFESVFSSGDFKWKLIDKIHIKDKKYSVDTRNLTGRTPLITNFNTPKPQHWHVATSFTLPVVDIFSELEFKGRYLNSLIKNGSLPTDYVFSYNYSSRRLQRKGQYLIYTKGANKGTRIDNRCLRLPAANSHLLCVIYNVTYILTTNLILNNLLNHYEDGSVLYFEDNDM